MSPCLSVWLPSLKLFPRDKPRRHFPGDLTVVLFLLLGLIGDIGLTSESALDADGVRRIRARISSLKERAFCKTLLPRAPSAGDRGNVIRN